MKRRSSKIILFVLLIISSIGLFGQQKIQFNDLKLILQPDPKIKIGVLPNGLKYYIRENKKPEHRAILRLAVNAGSVLENDDQQGLAHLVEHMAFNGTKHFPKNDLVNFLESIGIKFGADLNASTSHDQTVYMLQLPTDKEDLLEKGMLVLDDWSHEVSFDDVEIDKEQPLFTRWDNNLLEGVMVVEVAGQFIDSESWHGHLYQSEPFPVPAHPQSTRLVAIPYYAWGNRGIGGMRVWIPKKSI